MSKFIWWLRNRNRIYQVLQHECDLGRAYCMVFHVSARNQKIDVMKEIRRHRRNLDRLNQLHAGKSPWDTAKMDGWEKRDASFRRMEISYD